MKELVQEFGGWSNLAKTVNISIDTLRNYTKKGRDAKNMTSEILYKLSLGTGYSMDFLYERLVMREKVQAKNKGKEK